jgi:hypothetical protein
MLLIHKGGRGTCTECARRIDGPAIIVDGERFCSAWCAAADPTENAILRRQNWDQRLARAAAIEQIQTGGAR